MYNVYDSSEYDTHFSINNAMTYPISAPPATVYAPGDSNDFQLYGKNDGIHALSNITVSIVDTGSYPTAETWFKLASTQAGLDAAVAGASLSLSDANPGDTEVFWLRITIPSSHAVGDYGKVKLRITYTIGAVV